MQAANKAKEQYALKKAEIDARYSQKKNEIEFEFEESVLQVPRIPY